MRFVYNSHFFIPKFYILFVVTVYYLFHSFYVSLTDIPDIFLDNLLLNENEILCILNLQLMNIENPLCLLEAGLAHYFEAE